MTNEIDTKKDIILNGLKDLCQHYYLPFTNKQFNTAEEIIDDFLQTLLVIKVGCNNEPFFNSDSVLGIVPGFHFLNDFQSWKNTPINSYRVLANVSGEIINNIYNTQISWSDPECPETKNDTLSQKIIDTLNNGERNGRLKVIIKLKEQDEVEVKYIKEEKTIEYFIPEHLYANWILDIPKIEYQKGGIFTLSQTKTSSAIRPNFPVAISNYFKGFELDDEFRILAMRVFPIALQHFVYISSSTSLIYLFSNNTEIENKDVGLGGMFLLLENGIADDLSCVKCRKIINYFSRLTDALSSRLINFYQIQEVKKQATRNAIAQVMTRNMSHNIGSHVLNHLSDKNDLEKIDVNLFHSYTSNIEASIEDKQILNQLAFYNSYVKCRMDYLSDVTFGTPVMHTNKKVYNELFKGIDKVKLLLEYISGLSGFEYKIIFSKDGKPIDDSNDFPVAFPNDLLGCQAFYNIIENVIRNTAKHNQNKVGITEFTINFKSINKNTLPIELKEWEQQYYEVEIFDNLKVNGNKSFLDLEEKEHLLYIQNVNKYSTSSKLNSDSIVKEIDWLVYNQNIKINLSVLQENSQLRSSSLGLLEMEASAVYLRKLDITTIERTDYDIDFDDNIFNSKRNMNILKSINKNNCLGYRFFISKPTEFLLIGDFSFSEVQLNSLANDGILTSTEENFNIDLANGRVYNHQFVLYQESSTIDNVLKTYKTSLPIRLILIDDFKDLLTLINNNYSFIELEKFIWQQWFNKIKGSFDHINVFTSYDKDDGDHNRTNAYNIAFSDHNETWNFSKSDYLNVKINYLETLSSNAQSKLPNFKVSLKAYTNIRNEYLTITTKQKLYEAAISKVLVLDERIQRFAENMYSADGVDVPNKDIFQFTNVIIPNKIKLDANNYTVILTNSINNYIESRIEKCDFLLVHYSILERMYGCSKTLIKNKLMEWSKFTRVIITSGRGKPPELPGDLVCYVNLSPVLNVFSDNRSKYSINYLLNSARK